MTYSTKNINHSFKTTRYLDVTTSCNSKLMSRHNKPKDDKAHRKTDNLIVVNLKSTTGKQNHIKQLEGEIDHKPINNLLI